jgi:hypothetical protein
MSASHGPVRAPNLDAPTCEWVYVGMRRNGIGSVLHCAGDTGCRCSRSYSRKASMRASSDRRCIASSLSAAWTAAHGWHACARTICRSLGRTRHLQAPSITKGTAALRYANSRSVPTPFCLALSAHTRMHNAACTRTQARTLTRQRTRMHARARSRRRGCVQDRTATAWAALAPDFVLLHIGTNARVRADLVARCDRLVRPNGPAAY